MTAPVNKEPTAEDLPEDRQPIIDAALLYAEEHKYVYGPPFSRLKLSRQVKQVEELEAGVVRVHLEFQPVRGRFTGAGAEYIDFDSDGNVIARNIVNKPRSGRPWIILGSALISVISAAVLIPVFLIMAAAPPDTFAGRFIWIRVLEPPKTASQLHYQYSVEGNLINVAVLPVNPDNEITYIKVSLVNQQESQEALVIVDKMAAVLQDESGNSYELLDIAESSVSIQQVDNRYLAEPVGEFQIIWGSLAIPQAYVVDGYLAFETPKTATPLHLRWRALDTITIPLK